MTTPDERYLLIRTPPPLEAYLRLRAESGLTRKRADQAQAALTGSWAAAHIQETATGCPVAMGRVIGDGGWYFHIADMAVLPDHQRQGLGDRILTDLLESIRSHAPAGAWVTLMADPPGRRLYNRHGFRETAPDSLGMALTL
ncbi:GNAT family N-acetyltransferase [Arthrobacter sp. zg-Y1110]|uniref:GNAT family N-acetyltransferase n=1 Tax=Arthrobacter sp. zg-Y1110 TaxID=2886932 RepID=UPI001D13AD3B|nr:GNAT family N-acetyltransferase [Arthrobacter sp. zg-Y1110]MCC3292241.1 GNAT family N-acetyltransferase [Arthrobacter sp. zg-Y1110]UWX85323.1 GNAT family N-acetyltransferase [Arthrobacter sp. zg-Y1110]